MSEALRIAAELEHEWGADDEAAAELRRLVAENAAQRRDIQKQNEVNLLNVETLGYDLARLRALNAELAGASK